MTKQAEIISLKDPWVVPTEYWHQLDDGRIQCDLCPRFCKLKEGQRGLCFVRACVEGQIVLTTYGRSSGYCVDPIEKKPLNHFLPGTPVLSFGTAGCNLACKFCQNWDISKSREMDTLADHADPETIALAAEELGCRSVAYTYNDPVIFHEYAIDVARACHEKGIKSVAGNPLAIGYVSIGSAEYEVKLGAPTKLLALDGQPASTAALLAGQYPLSRELNLVVNGEPDANTRALLAFAQSREVADLVDQHASIPAP